MQKKKAVQEIADKLNITTETITKNPVSPAPQTGWLYSFSRDHSHTARLDSTQLNWL